MSKHKVIVGNFTAFTITYYITSLPFPLDLPHEELYMHYSNLIFSTNLCSKIYYFYCFTEEIGTWKVKRCFHGHAAKLWWSSALNLAENPPIVTMLCGFS